MDFELVKEASAYIMSKIRVIPRIAIVLGTGLGAFSEKLEDAVEIPYTEIPGFKQSSVSGHSGKVVMGKLAEKYVVALSGRCHYYEGYSLEEVTFPIWVLKEMGVSTLILTNAAGAINENYSIGDLVAVVDHIKLCLDSPLRGIGDNEYGQRFHDMSRVYDAVLTENLKEVAYGMGITVEDGVYAYMGGPQFETPAEIRALNLMGADLVGMSTVPEAIVANHIGMKILAVSCVTNYAAGVNGNEHISHEETKEIGEIIKDKFESLMDGLIGRIKAE